MKKNVDKAKIYGDIYFLFLFFFVRVIRIRGGEIFKKQGLYLLSTVHRFELTYLIHTGLLMSSC